MPESDAFQYSKNEIKKFNDAQQQAIAQQTPDLWRAWREQLRGVFINSREYWRMYNSASFTQPAVSTGEKDGKTIQEEKRIGITAAHIPRSVDSVLAIQHNSTFAADERFFTGSPRNELARTNRNMYDSFASDNLAEAEFTIQIINHRKNCIVDGTAVLALPWKEKRGTKVEYEFMEIPWLDSSGGAMKITSKVLDMFPPRRKETKNYVFWEGTKPEALNLNDWVADPNVQTFEEAGFIRRWYAPTWLVKKEYSLKEDVATYHQCQDEWENTKAEGVGVMKWSIGKSEAEGKDNALLMVRYDNFVVDGEVYENYVSIVLNDYKLLWFGPNPYDHGEKPYACTPYIPIPGQIYGKSGIQDAASAAATYDTTITQVIDIFAWAAKPAFMKNILDPIIGGMGDIEIKPGIQIPCNDPGAIRQLEVNMANALPLVQMLPSLESIIREAMNASPVFSGDAPNQEGGVPTAFQVGAHVEGGNNRNQIPMSIFNTTTLATIIRQKFANDRQYMTKSHMVPGFEGQLTPNLVKQMDMDFIIVATDASLARGKRIANIKEILATYPQFEAAGILRVKQEIGELDVLKLIQMLFQEGGMEEADEILKIISSPTEVVQQASTDGAINTTAEAIPNGQPAQLPPVASASAGPAGGEIPAAPGGSQLPAA